MFDKIKELIENFLFMKKYNIINEIKLLRKDIATIVQASLERQDDINTLLKMYNNNLGVIIDSLKSINSILCTYTDNQSEMKDVLEDIYNNTKYYSDEIPDIIDKLESIENTVSQPKVTGRKLKKKTLDE
jgi:Mg2+ and Co2+ transporter CorA